MNKEKIINMVLNINAEPVTKEQVEEIIFNMIFNVKFNSEYYGTYKGGFNRLTSDFEEKNNNPDCFVKLYEEIAKSLSKSKAPDMEMIKFDERLIQRHCYSEKMYREVNGTISSLADMFAELYNQSKIDADYVDNKLSDARRFGDNEDEYSISHFYGNMCVDAMMRDFVKKTIQEYAPALIGSFNDLTEEDCIRDFSRVDHPERSSYVNYMMKFADAEDILSYKYADIMIRERLFGVIYNKFREIVVPRYKEMEVDQIQELNEYIKDQDRRMPGVVSQIETAKQTLAELVMAKYKEEFSDFEMSEEFLKEFSENCCKEDIYTCLTRLKAAENLDSVCLGSFGNVLSAMQAYIPVNLDRKKKADFMNEMNQESNVMNYVRGKANAILDKAINDELVAQQAWRDSVFEEEKVSPLQFKFDTLTPLEKEQLNEDIIQFVKDMVEAKTGHNLCCGVLSEEFIKAHRAELIKIFANSKYDDEKIVQMVRDVIHPCCHIIEPNM